MQVAGQAWAGIDAGKGQAITWSSGRLGRQPAAWSRRVANDEAELTELIDGGGRAWPAS